MWCRSDNVSVPGEEGIHSLLRVLKNVTFSVSFLKFQFELIQQEESRGREGRGQTRNSKFSYRIPTEKWVMEVIDSSLYLRKESKQSAVNRDTIN